MNGETVTMADIKSISNLQELWEETIDIWQHGFLGIDIGKIIIALLIFSAFMLFRGLFSKYVLSKLHGWSTTTSTKLDDKVVDALIPPIRFIPVILGIFFAATYSGLDEILPDFFARTMRTLISFTIFWALHRVLEPFSHLMRGLEKMLTRMMVKWIFKLLKVLVVFIGGAVILEIWGIQVGPLLAGLGLFGAAVALGAQDLFKNLIGGMTIIAEKRFHPGDWIKVDGVVEGTVEDIGFRSTRVRRFDKAPVHVPNALLSDAAITNFSRMTNRRIYWKIGVEYKTTTKQLKIIRDEIMSYIEENEDFEKQGVSTFVRIDCFSDSSIDIMIYCFTKTTVWGEWLEIKEAFAFKIKEIIESKAKTAFAFPSQSLYLEQWPGDTAEVFIPPTGSGSKTKKAA
jgi:MscS family membrane protein